MILNSIHLFILLVENLFNYFGEARYRILKCEKFRNFRTIMTCSYVPTTSPSPKFGFNICVNGDFDGQNGSGTHLARFSTLQYKIILGRISVIVRVDKALLVFPLVSYFTPISISNVVSMILLIFRSILEYFPITINKFISRTRKSSCVNARGIPPAV